MVTREVASRRWLWSCVAVTAGTWMGLMLLLCAQIEVVTPGASGVSSKADLEAAVEPWRERVVALEASLAELQKVMETIRDTNTPPGHVVGIPPKPDRHPDLPPIATSSVASSGLLLRRTTPADSQTEALISTNLAWQASPFPPMSLGRASPREETNKQCTFVSDVDYPSETNEDMVPGLTRERCCELCTARNRANPGSCMVAVLSGLDDTPPHACWLKGKVTRPVTNPGVEACWPSGQQPILQEAGSHPKENERAASLAALATGVAGYGPDTLRRRADAIRGAMLHAWGNYHDHAWGNDELKPLAGTGSDRQFFHAVTMVDALDTLWIMGLKTEFAEAREWLVKNLPEKLASMKPQTSLFETTIRTLGGLLGAYELSRDPAFINLAVPLAHKINRVVSSTGIVPYTFGGGRGSPCNSLAESGTIQLEMRYLSNVTGDPIFAAKVDRFYDTVRGFKSIDGLWPNCFQSQRGIITFGANGDSFYEYLLKVWVMEGRPKGHKLWGMYAAAAQGLEKRLVKKGKDTLTYLGTFNWDGNVGGSYGAEMEHLTCFVPGWLALGSQSQPSESMKAGHLELAASIAYTCWQMYAQQPTGIGPERVKYMKMDLRDTDTREYILRPEAVEGWWYMHEVTHDARYRDWGWHVFEAMEKNLRVEHGYASLKDVRMPGRYIDRMESFFLAETLKYLYLLQDPDHAIHLDKFVFNTEGHPLSILPQPLASKSVRA